MKKIIIVESATDSLRTFARLMAKGFQKKGFQVLMANMEEEGRTREEIFGFVQPGKSVTLFFDHAGLNLLTETRASIY